MTMGYVRVARLDRCGWTLEDLQSQTHLLSSMYIVQLNNSALLSPPSHFQVPNRILLAHYIM